LYALPANYQSIPYAVFFQFCKRSMDYLLQTFSVHSFYTLALICAVLNNPFCLSKISAKAFASAHIYRHKPAPVQVYACGTFAAARLL
jgi:hypothetical protein